MVLFGHVKFVMPFGHRNGEFTWAVVYESGTQVNICVKKTDSGVNICLYIKLVY